jgi:hypothetical protein
MGGMAVDILLPILKSTLLVFIYIDLNPLRANIVRRPEDYRWSSLGYHARTGNKGNFLSLDF